MVPRHPHAVFPLFDVPDDRLVAAKSDLQAATVRQARIRSSPARPRRGRRCAASGRTTPRTRGRAPSEAARAKPSSEAAGTVIVSSVASKTTPSTARSVRTARSITEGIDTSGARLVTRPLQDRRQNAIGVHRRSMGGSQTRPYTIVPSRLRVIAIVIVASTPTPGTIGTHHSRTRPDRDIPARRETP